MASFVPINHLLQSLPSEDNQRLVDQAECVRLTLGEVVYESGVALEQVLFPLDSIVSLLYVLSGDDSAELAVVGNEGVVGLSLFLGGATTTGRAVVQHAGYALRVRASVFKAEIGRHGALQSSLLRYTHALMTQMMQTAACNLHHSADQQLSRWLLMSLDRLPSSRILMTEGLIANMLGMRRDGVAAATDRLRDAGLIKYASGEFYVLDRPGLEKRACECYSTVAREYQPLLEPAHCSQ